MAFDLSFCLIRLHILYINIYFFFFYIQEHGTEYLFEAIRVIEMVVKWHLVIEMAFGAAHFFRNCPAQVWSEQFEYSSRSQITVLTQEHDMEYLLKAS